MKPLSKRALASLIVLAYCAGCAGGPPPPPPEVAMDSVVVQAEFNDVWQAAKSELVDQGFDIYTRDSRGMFVAYKQPKRRFRMPRRERVTVILERVTTSSTSVSIEAVRERYRTPILKHSGWKEQPKFDLPETRQQLLSGIETRATTEPPAA